jgi:hypothetical protein
VVPCRHGQKSPLLELSGRTMRPLRPLKLSMTMYVHFKMSPFRQYICEISNSVQWQYFAPVQQGMPKNCSKDVSLVIDYIDNVLTTGTAANKTSLKTMFGLQDVQHDDDFASALENGPWMWQGNSFTTGYSQFYQFCDAVEVTMIFMMCRWSATNRI